MKSGFKIQHYKITNNPECIIVYNFDAWNKVANVMDIIAKNGMLALGRWQPKGTKEKQLK